MKRYSNFIQTLGPGILFASTAIGVSHLIQSTRAGAVYGFSLIIFVLLANILKYPFFEFGSRYANITGTSLLHAYKKISKWLLVVYFLLTFFTMFIVIAAVNFVCSGLFMQLFNVGVSINIIALFLFLVCILILINGKFSILDIFIKVIGVILLISTLLSFLLSFFTGGSNQLETFIPPNIFDESGILFLIALMGWMPASVDMSVWNSIWTIERIEQTQYRPKLKETLLDFNIGYIITIILSICFLTMGALLIYGTGETLPDSSPDFAAKIVSLYTHSLGEWSYLIITLCVFSVMFSTTLAVFDGYSRSIKSTVELLFDRNLKKLYTVCLIVLAFGGYLILSYFMNDFKKLIDFATTTSFLIAPFCAIANHVVIFSSDISIEKQPPKWLKFLSILGILFLLSFSLVFIVYV